MGGFEAAGAAVVGLLCLGVGCRAGSAKGVEAGADGGFAGEVFEEGLPVVVGPEAAPLVEAEPLGGFCCSEAGGGAGPGELLGGGDNVGADRVAFDVGEGAPDVGGVEGDGVVAGLPEVAAGVAVDVDDAGVIGVEATEGDGGGVGVVGDGDEVVVVRHEAIAEDFELVFGGVLGEEAEEEVAVAVGVEDLLAGVAALGEVVGEAGDDDAWAAGHTLR